MVRTSYATPRDKVQLPWTVHGRLVGFLFFI